MHAQWNILSEDWFPGVRDILFISGYFRGRFLTENSCRSKPWNMKLQESQDEIIYSWSTLSQQHDLQKTICFLLLQQITQHRRFPENCGSLLGQSPRAKHKTVAPFTTFSHGKSLRLCPFCAWVPRACCETLATFCDIRLDKRTVSVLLLLRKSRRCSAGRDCDQGELRTDRRRTAEKPFFWSFVCCLSDVFLPFSK